MINPKTQQFMAKRMGARKRSLAVDHTPLLSAPKEVVNIILEATLSVEEAMKQFPEKVEISRYGQPEEIDLNV